MNQSNKIATRWKKAYKGPLQHRKALELQQDIKARIDSGKSPILKVAVRKGNGGLYDVYIKVPKDNEDPQ